MKERKNMFKRREFLALSGSVIAGDYLVNFSSPAHAKSYGSVEKEKLTGKKDSEWEEKRGNLVEKAYKLGFEQLSNGIFPGCALCTIAAIQDTLSIRNDTVLKAASGLSGGGEGPGLGNCGSYTGSALVIGQLCGCERSNSTLESCASKSSNMIAVVTEELNKEFGSIICRDIQVGIFGRYFDFKNKKEREQFKEAGASEKCSNVVGKGSQFAVKLIIDEELVRI